MYGTQIYGIVFCFGALVVLLFGGRYIWNDWHAYFVRAQLAQKTATKSPDPVPPLTRTLVMVCIFVVAVTLGWNNMLRVTTSSSDTYRSPGEISEQNAVKESHAVTPQEIDRVRAEQKERAQSAPHKEALSNFDSAMAAEAEKIKQRSLASVPIAPASADHQ